MREKFVLVGAGSVSFTRGLVVDLVQRGAEGELALVDVSPEALAIAEGFARKVIEAGGSKLKLSATTDLRKALPDATAVICTIAVGGRKAWETDLLLPRKWGIWQPVGDTSMPGGTSRALRMIPAMVDIAQAVVELAPKALFFNYGNPMVPVCTGIRKATGANVIGLCHGVFHVAGMLAEVLGVPGDELVYTALGYNHLTWFTELRHQGQDLLPKLKALGKEKLAQVPAALGKQEVAGLNPFTWHMLELFGGFPAVLDRHICEFFPAFFADGAYYGIQFGKDVYTTEELIEGGDAGFEEMRQVALSLEPLSDDYFKRIGGEHEQVVDIIDSIRRDLGTIYSVNVPNEGQVTNLPRGAVIECPAMATAAGLRPIQCGAMPQGMAATLASRFAWVDLTVEAALEGDRGKFVQALVVDGSVREPLRCGSAGRCPAGSAQPSGCPSFGRGRIS